jgi:hypothetical protein
MDYNSISYLNLKHRGRVNSLKNNGIKVLINFQFYFFQFYFFSNIEKLNLEKNEWMKN